MIVAAAPAKLLALVLLLPAFAVVTSFQSVVPTSFVASASLVSSSSSTSRSTSLSASSTASGSSAAVMEEVKVGDAVPSVELSELATGQDRPTKINLKDLVSGKKVAIFGVPGAFTPGCSKSHLPSFISAQSDLQAKGVEMTICLATNDAYTMEAWGRTSGGSDAGIRFLADDTGALTKALGLVMETPIGIRTKRFSLVAEDGIVTNYFSSAKESSDTWAPNVLAAL